MEASAGDNNSGRGKQINVMNNKLKGFFDNRPRIKRATHNLNQFLNKPVAVIIVLLLFFVYFAYDNVQFQKDNKVLLENSNTTVGQLKKVLCEDVPDDQCNLSKAVSQILEDHKRQDRFNSCILAYIGKPELQPSEVTAECQRQEATLNDAFASNTSISPPASSTKQDNNTNPPTTQNQNTVPQDQQPQGPGNGNGNGPPPSVLEQIQGFLKGVLSTISKWYLLGARNG